MTSPPRLLKAAEAADRLGVSEKTIYRMTLGGELPKVTVGPRLIRIPETALADWITRHTEGGAGDR